VIVSAIETAADRPRPPVLVEAVGTQILGRAAAAASLATHSEERSEASLRTRSGKDEVRRRTDN